MKIPRATLVPPTPEEAELLRSLISCLDVPNPKWTEIKIRYALFGLRQERIGLKKEHIAYFATSPEDFEIFHSSFKLGRGTFPSRLMDINKALAEAERRVFPKRLNEITKQLKAAENAAIALMRVLGNRDLKEYFDTYSQGDHNPSRTLKALAERLVNECSTLKRQCNIHLNIHQRHKGRPRHLNFVRLVEDIISLYNEFSPQHFTLHRYSDESQDGEFVPITPGHRFVTHVIRWLEKEALNDGKTVSFSSSNIYVACEAAQKTLKDKLLSQ